MDKVEKDFLSSAGFTPDNIRTKSSAAAGLCAWVINICKYFRIYQVGGGSIVAFTPRAFFGKASVIYRAARCLVQ